MRAAVPGLALSTDIIVGFPGETAEDFEMTRDAMRRIGYDSAFLFKYSPRPGARAAEWVDDVPDDEKTRRITILIEEQKDASLERNAAMVGRDVDVLVEGPSKRNPEHWFGKTREFKTAVFRRSNESVGDLVTLRVAAASPYTLFGDGVSSRVQAEEDATL
jgi:tRNA-2-methylthio-N6-dimethylallyladenosine synthase